MESSRDDYEEERVVNAQEVYLLMNDDYKISRNSRVNWYLHHLSSSSTISAHDKQGSEEFCVLSIQGPRSLLEFSDNIVFRVTTSTVLMFLAKAYRFVYVLDLSPSITGVDLVSGTVLLDEVFVNLQRSLKALIKPFKLPGNDVAFIPKIYVTVLCHTSVISCKENQVLLQGCLVTEDNLDSILDQLRRDLEVFENRMAESLAEITDLEYYGAEDDRITFGLFEETTEQGSSSDPSMCVMSPEASFINMLRYGILALQLLPENSMAGIIVITDGVIGLPDHSLFESLMMQLRHHMVSCSFLQLGSGFQLQSGLGQVPYPELMDFIAAATMGVYYTNLPDADMNVEGMLPLQRALLTQKIQNLSISPDIARIDVSGQDGKLVSSVHTRKHKEKNLHISLATLISCRLRDGYFIKNMSFIKGDSQIEVRMVLPWRPGVNINCVAVSAWPINTNKSLTHIEISVEGSYHFILDITSHLKHKGFHNSYRVGLVLTYWQAIQSMSESDELLVHLHSFSSNATHYKVADSLKQGVPLFYLPPNQTSPQINIQLSTKDNTLSQFATFWKPVLNLDINIWQKWMHTHRIGLILEHDVPLGKHLHIPNSSGRFHSATCRLASAALNFFLRDYSTFVLMENHSYVTLLPKEEDKPSVSFFVIRVTSKPPCVVLRLAFLGDTPGQVRDQIVSDLKNQLSVLRFLQRSPKKEEKSPPSLARRGLKPDAEVKKHQPPLQRVSSDIPCCVLTRKPIEKILIRYDRMPHDFTTTDLPQQLERSSHMTSLTANKLAFNIYTTLSRYLFHRRWIWSIQHGTSMSVSMHAIGRILSNVTKIRLQEGFNFAHTNSGIINLVLELDMKVADNDDNDDADDGSSIHPCVIQYVAFPPYTTVAKGSVSEEDVEDTDGVHGDEELQIITECWVEPQCGVVVNSTPERKHFDGLNYKEVAQTMFPTDLDCISTMITFEHLNLMCQSPEVPSPAPHGTTPLPNISMVEEDYHTTMSSEISIKTVSFPFDLMRLLPKCQQVELLFSTYIQDFSDDKSRYKSVAANSDQSQPNQILFTLFMEHLKAVHDREIQLTEFECEQLVSLIEQRERNLELHHLPFVPRHKNVHVESESALSVATSLSGSVGQSMATLSTVASQSQTATSTAASQSQTAVTIRATTPTTTANEGEEETPAKTVPTDADRLEKGIPRWRCFVRSLTNTHIMLCFVPSTFGDLCALKYVNDPQESKRPSFSTGSSNGQQGDPADGGGQQLESPVDSHQGNHVGSEPQVETPGEGGQQETSPQNEEPSASQKPTAESKRTTKEEVTESTHPEAITLPCYIYNCPLSYLSDQLVNKWTFSCPPDIYEDLTFKTSDDAAVQISDLAIGEDEVAGQRLHRISESVQREGQTDDLYQDAKELKQHCTMVSETYLRCFVKGVYQSLQHDYVVDRRDVDAAINEICEESLPIEIDISHFLQCSCGHVRHIMEKANLERMFREDLSKTQPKVISKLADDDSEEELATKDNLSSDFVTPNEDVSSPLYLPLDVLISGTTCEAAPNLHQLIRTQFQQIVNQFFKQISTNPDYYYFRPASYETGGLSPREDIPETEYLEQDREPRSTLSGDSTIMYDLEIASQKEMVEGDDGESVQSNKNSMSTLSVLADDELDDLDDAELERNKMQCHPLFVYLMCSVRTKNNTLRSIPITNIPLCFAEIVECLHDLKPVVDLSTVHITLDVICLSLPLEEDLSESFKRPCYQRMTSHNSQISNSSVVDCQADTEENISIHADGGLVTRSVGADPLQHLPKAHREAVHSCKQQVLWLLRDEITSIMRCIEPVTEETLKMVINHVISSDEKPMCLTKHVPLKFVGGSSQCLPVFIEDFERMNLPGFHLNREGNYYYLSVDRAYGYTQAHAKALQNALTQLDYTDIKDIALKAANKNDLNSDGIDLLEQPNGDPELRSHQQGDDIKISVTRPSPVKELPKHSTPTMSESGKAGNGRKDHSIQQRDSEDLEDSKQYQSITDKQDAPLHQDDSRQQTDTEATGTLLSPTRLTSAQVEDGHSKIVDDIQDGQSSEGNTMAVSLARGLSPLTLISSTTSNADVDRKCMRRAHSSASFEKYKHDKVKSSSDANKSSNPQTPNISGWSTPQRQASGTQTPSRSRHHSGIDISTTPMSTIETSSGCSLGYDGYDGDSSDLDDEGVMMSFNESLAYHKRVLPDFWLIMKIKKDCVDLYFHTRDTGEDNHEQIVHYKMLYNQMITEIMNTCRVVNQKVLLDRLYTTRMCDKLLVPEADEEVCWGKDTMSRQMYKYIQDNVTDSEDSDVEGQEKVYFDAARDTNPGHFACECVWQTDLILHPRLKTGRGNMSRGIQTLKSSVLNKFSVNNRKNMFVIKENSTGAVFYLRLEEKLCDTSTMSTTNGQKPHEDWSASRSSSVVSLNTKKTGEAEDETNCPVKAEERPVLLRQRSEDVITLSAHGICPVGPEISHDLKELLQKKLDDAVLKVLIEIMARNPMCKLTPEDVKFIQRPNSRPQCTFAYKIPSSAMLQQFALSHYLRQNLSQFVHTPKYMDNNQAHVFLDYTQTPAKPMHEDYVFLYNRPQQSGGNGIACLYLSFVDGTGQPVQLISSPKPSSEAYKDVTDSSMFESLVYTEKYIPKSEKQSPSKLPGPLFLVQFTVWAQGTIDMTSLSDQLMLAVKHAVADVITEYRLLTAPICEPPSHYYRGLDTPIYSAPPSPGPGRNSDSHHVVSANEIKKQISDGGEKTPKDKSLFSIHSLVPDIFHKSKEKEDMGTSAQTTEVKGRQQDINTKLYKYESGERGKLLPLYYKTLNDWFNFCHQLKLPALSRQQVTLSNRFPMDYVLESLITIINNTSQDLVTRVFKKMTNKNGDVSYLPYKPSRNPLESLDKDVDTTLDFGGLHSRLQHLPGSSSDYIVIARNILQWRASIEYTTTEETNNELPSLTNPKTQKSYQKYKPLMCDVSCQRPEAGGVMSVDRNYGAFVPRQRMLMIVISDKTITVYLYNWAADLCSSIERQVLRLSQWHNARSRVLLAICSQKMGLFQHNPLRVESNPFSQSHSEMDLVKFTSAPSQPSQRKVRSLSGSMLPMDIVYRDNKPTNPMHKSGHGSLRDPIHRHGAQLLELWNYVKTDTNKKMSLQELYLNWQQRAMIPNVQISEEMLNLLKRSSRLIHSVVTPVLFSPQWRRKILGQGESAKGQESPSQDSKQTRSRHSSGASIKSRRSGSVDGRWPSQSSMDSPDLSQRPSLEDSWLQDTLDCLLNQYALYLQELGVHPIKTDSGSHQKLDRYSRPGVMYLQKTLPGGIMLVQIGFSDVYFSINVYGFEVSSLPVSKNVNPQLAVLFTDECEKFKDMTHAHSFSHDFHLKTVLNYIRGGHFTTLRCNNYHVTRLLIDFVQQYPITPNYAQNYIYQGTLIIEDINSPSHQLFDYMLQHADLYDMKTIKMAPISEDVEVEEYALVLSRDQPTVDVSECDLSSKVNPSDYQLGLVIAHHNQTNSKSTTKHLVLDYWLILVNTRATSLVNKPERRQTQPKLDIYPANMSAYGFRSKQSPDEQRIASSTPDTVNYLGFSNSHQTAVYQLLLNEVKNAKQYIYQLVSMTVSHCRRDALWQRMILGEMAEEENKRKRHKTGDPYMTKLSFKEFEEMLGMVTQCRISDIDPELKALENMSRQWYQSLGKVLTHKYPESLRTFTNTDGSIQHYIVLNPKQLDMLMMLSVDMSGDKSGLCFVYKEEPRSECTGLQDLELFEMFINTCCYHMWASLL